MSPRTVEAPPLRRMIIPAIFVGALFLALFLRQPDRPGEPTQWVFDGPTMGTEFTVKLTVPEGFGATEEEAAELIRSTVDDVNYRMSTYRPDSEINRFNHHGTEPFEASPALLDVVAEAQRVAELTDGAFDITIGPLVEAWGFGPEGSNVAPANETIDRLLADNDYRHLELDGVAGTLRKTRAGVRCDLSAIAKGFAADRVALALTGLGVVDFMVEIGGEVKAAGVNSTGQPWRIGVERPEAGRRGVWSAVPLENAAMATSGDYRNYYERDGVRISHLIDPRTGRPITHNLASVTVIHPSCMTADAIATALGVLGPDEGRALVQQEGLAVLMLIRNPEGGFDEWTSEWWPDGITTGEGAVDRGESD